ncbi:MAG: LuxR family transcriptional regulator [Flavobacteriales bacterium]|nr:LuxR family transcriptional regulator [Flavobacteriales bacterium]
MSKSEEIGRLNEEAWSFRETDRKKAEELALQALELAEKAKNKDQILLARLTLAQGANFRMELDTAEQHIAFVGDRIGENTPLKVRVRYYHQQCYHHYQKSQFPELIEVGHQLLELMNDSGFEKLRAWTLATMGMAYQRLGNGNLALESYRKAEKVITVTNDLGALSNIRMSIGAALAELGRKKEALEIFEESLNARLSVGGDFHAGIILSNIAMLQSQLGEHSKALLRWAEGSEYLKKAGGMPLWVQALGGRADTLRQMKRLEEARDQMNEAIAEATDLPAPIQINLHLNMSRIHADANMWNESISSLNTAYQLMDAKSTDYSQRIDLHSGFYRAYKATGDLASALEHHEQMAELRQKHLNEQSVTKLAEWEALYHMERLQEKDEKLIKKTAELEDILRTSANERKVLLGRLASYDVLLDEMLHMLPETARGRFSRLVRAARKSSWRQEEDEILQSRISEKHPELTPSELRTCGMIINGWTTKEMSDRGGISIKTVEKHRGAIRRKAGIPRSVSLQVYLSGIAKIA